MDLRINFKVMLSVIVDDIVDYMKDDDSNNFDENYSEAICESYRNVPVENIKQFLNYIEVNNTQDIEFIITKEVHDGFADENDEYYYYNQVFHQICHADIGFGDIIKNAVSERHYN